MTKTERKQITASLTTVIEALNKSISPVSSKDRVCIICEQITALRGVVGDIVKGGGIDG